jgi:two-component system, response regulator
MADPIEILLVEDNPNDVQLTLLAFRRHNFANTIEVARDGEEALDFMFATGPSHIATRLCFRAWYCLI